jgi:hypothetical protein
MQALIAALALAALAQQAGPEPTKTADLVEMLKGKDPAVKRAAAEEAAGSQAAELLVPLSRLLGDEDLEVRRAAVLALAARTEEGAKRTAASALGERLRSMGEKGEPGERIALADALHDLAQPGSVKILMDGIKTDTAREEVEARLHAVGNIPTREAVEGLIDFTASVGRGKRGDWHAAARSALKYAVRYDVGGPDPDLWRAWWRDHGKEFDFKAAAASRAEERAAAAEKERKKKEAADKAEERKRDREGQKKDGGKKDGGKKDGGKKDGGEKKDGEK